MQCFWPGEITPVSSSSSLLLARESFFKLVIWMFLRWWRLFLQFIPLPVAQLIPFKSSDAILVWFKLNVILGNDANPNSLLKDMFKFCRLYNSPNTPLSAFRDLQCNISRKHYSVRESKDDSVRALMSFREISR